MCSARIVCSEIKVVIVSLAHGLNQNISYSETMLKPKCIEKSLLRFLSISSAIIESWIALTRIKVDSDDQNFQGDNEFSS